MAEELKLQAGRVRREEASFVEQYSCHNNIVLTVSWEREPSRQMNIGDKRLSGQRAETAVDHLILSLMHSHYSRQRNPIHWSDGCWLGLPTAGYSTSRTSLIVTFLRQQWWGSWTRGLMECSFQRSFAVELPRMRTQQPLTKWFTRPFIPRDKLKSEGYYVPIFFYQVWSDGHAGF